ncbi:10508_t:CDS:2 [Acaulospora colombiana]|uniref:10508_t:CDS:1 n=1 Tax=Acaulospora colombiana TaxID=27376 RepID=A0ACA9NZ91_9GLOM|nr:10508_t:CDS:2 [Acaulospora colombiana]
MDRRCPRLPRIKSPPTYAQCLRTAAYVLKALEEVGEPSCCLIGGLGIKLHGIKRGMKMTIKQALCDHDPERFCLIDPIRTPNATFKRLMYHVPRSPRLIEIDLLFANEPSVEIPRGLTIEQAVVLSGLPVAPLHFILYHKLLGWEDRVDAVGRPDKRQKANSKDRLDILRQYRTSSSPIHLLRKICVFISLCQNVRVSTGWRATFQSYGWRVGFKVEAKAKVSAMPLKRARRTYPSMFDSGSNLSPTFFSAKVREGVIFEETGSLEILSAFMILLDGD